MKYIGFFDEYDLYVKTGSLKDSIVENIDYDKAKVIAYLNSFERYAACPKILHDCITGEEICQSFNVITDGEYEWCSFLLYYIDRYNIALPKEFIETIHLATA